MTVRGCSWTSTEPGLQAEDSLTLRMRRTFLRCTPRAAAILGLFVACQPKVPVQVLTRRAPATAPSTPPAESGPWSYRPKGTRLDYAIEQRAELVIQQDTAVRRDSVSSVTDVTFTLDVAALRVVGTVSSFRVSSSGAANEPPQGLSLPFPFVATFSGPGHQAVFVAPSAPPCATPALPVAQSLRDFWFEVPGALRLGTIWEDSATYASCRDGVLMRVFMRRTFRVSSATERAGRVFLTVVRLTRTSLEGGGVQAGEPVSITGLGSGELTYTLDPGLGEIASARGSSTLELALRSRLRTQFVRQAAVTRINRSR